ncbi:efflux RND transporter periplasmic adaptor subunit [Aurantiacibacter xanthus]|uniref:Efflux RND transporter periplasmic adaptor subunit n=1 Tax=Aurantiacibacter xanthus TaxID=1784712 RepID=A0A3A1P2L7_9SPHN|nr:efflux RND transporter periplasmic adaptor subunit [Aurantiacibacter xanthus]RIV82356.1 efflux RND transporter periplasmic adaptor subunit [Aurantiacibacter xanthus]
MIAKVRKRASLAVVGTLGLVLAACSSPEQAPPPEIEVAVLKVKPEPLALFDELPGRVVAYRVAEIRPQVGGIVQRQLFEQGSEVRAGQPLFQINAAPFQADANSSAAALQRAQATFARARLQEERLRPLVDADAISRQSYDDARVARDQAAADVAEARAALARRRLDVGFARITSPISGRIGEALVTEGALVSANDANPLATVHQIDQVYIDVRQPVARIETMRAAIEAGTADENAPVEILSTEGQPYPVKGRMLFSGITVDPSTGNAVVRVLVPNPDRRLLPGMFVRARLPRTFEQEAITVPQQAVRRDPSGKAQVFVVDGKGQVAARDVVVGDVIEGRYHVSSGLRAGETVIVEGQDKVQPDVPVKSIAWRPAAAAAR